MKEVETSLDAHCVCMYMYLSKLHQTAVYKYLFRADRKVKNSLGCV